MRSFETMGAAGGRGTLAGGLRWSALFAAICLALGNVASAQDLQRDPPPASPASVATWIAASVLDSPESVRRAVQSAASNGATTLIVPAPVHDPSGATAFGDLLRQAHERGLTVLASIDVVRVVRAGDLPASRDHVIYQHPEWLMVPRALAIELLALDPRTPDYLGRLTRWTRVHQVDGLYVSPALPDAAAYLTAAATAFAARFPVDGILLDGAWYPDQSFDYSRYSVSLFRYDRRRLLPAPVRLEMDAVEGIDPFVYQTEFPAEWQRFRQAALTGLVARLRTSLLRVRPNVPIAAAVSAAPHVDLDDHLQDWRTWLENGFVDAVAARTGTAVTISSDFSTLPAATSGSH